MPLKPVKCYIQLRRIMTCPRSNQQKINSNPQLVGTAQNLHSRYYRRELAITTGELNVNYRLVIIATALYFLQKQGLANYHRRFAWDLSQGLFYVLANPHELLGIVVINFNSLFI
jgi:hypothetical protein